MTKDYELFEYLYPCCYLPDNDTYSSVYCYEMNLIAFSNGDGFSLMLDDVLLQNGDGYSFVLSPTNPDYRFLLL